MSRTRICTVSTIVGIAAVALTGVLPAPADALHPAAAPADQASDPCYECALPALGRVEFAADLIQ
jgi:hypothetical protein